MTILYLYFLIGLVMGAIVAREFYILNELELNLESAMITFYSIILWPLVIKAIYEHFKNKT